ncbi:hypothetical protein VTK56DRAFT_2466 [Thermocarpiscus australiensis]
MSALAAKANDLVGAAAGLLLHKSASMTMHVGLMSLEDGDDDDDEEEEEEKERRRQRLKQSIRAPYATHNPAEVPADYPCHAPHPTSHVPTVPAACRLKPNAPDGHSSAARPEKMSSSLVASDQPLVQVCPQQDVEEAQTVVQSIQEPPSSATALQLPADSDEVAEDEGSYSEGSYYWDASTMAPLNAVSAAAIARLRAYKPPPFPLWDRLPLSRRAAVLLLLYADRRGDLRVVITMRAASLRSFSGHAALPGGKADSLDETPYQIARREAWEEIGLPMDDAKIPAPFRIEHLCYLPMNLARTELVVRPCVALLHTTATTAGPTAVTAEDSLIPRLDAKEVAAVFSAPFHNFLKATDEPQQVQPDDGNNNNNNTPVPRLGVWYEGSWTAFHGEPWRVHYFYVPVAGQRVVKPRVRGRRKRVNDDGLAALAEDGGGAPSAEKDRAVEKKDAEEGGEEEEASGRYKVWGMTARILVDAATIAYGETPEFEHNSHFGDEELIERLARRGRLGEKKPGGGTGEEVKKVRDAVAAAVGGGQGGKNGGEASKM